MDSATEKVIWNPYTKGYLENPYHHLKKCREQNPIQLGFHNEWMFFKYEDVSKILRSKDFSVSNLSGYLKDKEPYIFKNSNACPYLATGTKKWPMYLNDSEHKSVRGIIGRAFNELDVQAILNDAMESLQHQFDPRDKLDLVSYCSQFVFYLTKGFFGFKDNITLDEIKSYSNLLAVSQDILVPKQVYKKINTSLLWGNGIYENSAYKNHIDNLAKESNLNLTEDELNSIMSISLMAAFETSKDNLTVALYEILKKPELITFILNCDAKSLDILIEELFRFSAPLQFTLRVNKKELTYGDITIPKNSKLYLSIASANRDADIFKNPNSIVHDRALNNHLSFGAGVHFCLGAQIARRELKYCLKFMLNFLKGYEIDIEKKPIWSKQVFMRTLKSLPLVPKSNFS